MKGLVLNLDSTKKEKPSSSERVLRAGEPAFKESKSN
jgi:hypothetical protein